MKQKIKRFVIIMFSIIALTMICLLLKYILITAVILFVILGAWRFACLIKRS